MSCEPTEYSLSDYIASRKKNEERLAAIEVLIDKALLVTLETIEGMGGGVVEYWLDDSQVKIKTTYRSIDEVQKGILALEKLRNMYMSRLRGRAHKMRDITKFRR